MSSFYLSKRNYKKDSSVRLYAVSQVWNAQKGRQVKNKQIYLGCKHADGRYSFNSNAVTYLSLLRGTEFERAFYNWQDYQNEQKALNKPIAQDEKVKLIDEATVLDAGTDLLLSTVSEKCGLTDTLTDVFGESLSDSLLCLAYYCVANPRSPIYAASTWSLDQKLPGFNPEIDGELSCNEISKIMGQVSESLVLDFLQKWLERFPKEHRLSLDITSVSSYSKNCPEVMYGYNRDHEKLPQINLLMMVDQETKLPVWIEKLPGAIGDITTIKDTIKLLKQLDNSPRAIVCDRGFASKENIKCLQENNFKFTMGLPLYRFSDVRDIIKTAVDAHEFNQPGITVDLFEEFGTLPSQAITKVVKWNDHRVYLHLYYCADYRTKNHNELMTHIDHVSEALKQGKEIKSEFDKHLVEKCFSVKTTPVRGLKVTCDPAKVAELEEEYGGYFVIASNQIKDPKEALYVYKLRDGVEKRFDDLKNEEDCHRLRMHSSQRITARVFIQFLAQILRCWLLNERQKNETLWKELKLGTKTVNDIMRAMKPLKYIHINGHHSFFKRPTKTQIALMKFFGISTENRLSWPSLH